MSSVFKLGLTGGIACGKTSAAEVFVSLGVPVISADAIAREIMQPGSPVLQQVVQAFGPEFLEADGSLKRAALREKVFADPAALQKLNSLTHPVIHELLSERAAQAGLTAPYVVLDIPLLFEHHLENTVDRILVLDCTEEMQVQRILQRDHCDEATARAILHSQVPRSYRLSHGYDIIDTQSGSLEKLASHIRELHQLYLQLARKAAQE